MILVILSPKGGFCIKSGAADQINTDLQFFKRAVFLIDTLICIEKMIIIIHFLSWIFVYYDPA